MRVRRLFPIPDTTQGIMDSMSPEELSALADEVELITSSMDIDDGFDCYVFQGNDEQCDEWVESRPDNKTYISKSLKLEENYKVGDIIASRKHNTLGRIHSIKERQAIITKLNTTQPVYFGCDLDHCILASEERIAKAFE